MTGSSQRQRLTSQNLMHNSLYVPLSLAALYFAFFCALLTPFFQRQFIFLHSIRFPLYPDFSNPVKHGLAPFKARNLTLVTHDKEHIGAWHILPEPYYQSQIKRLRNEAPGQDIEGFSENVYNDALRDYPTILYLHGNAMSRAAPFRIAAYTALTSRIDANVIAIDYRGFGDSTGTPSEAGLVDDAFAAYRWIVSNQISSWTPSQIEDRDTDSDAQFAFAQTPRRPSITVFGQSLGTGVAALLAARLDRQGTPLDNVVLMAPYANLRLLVNDYKLGGVLPVLAPLRGIPFHDNILRKFMKTHLNTLKTLPELLDPPGSVSPATLKASNKTNVVLLHARDDPIIPVSHSRMLFKAMSERCKPERVHNRNVNGFAKIEKFDCHGEQSSKFVTIIETQFGGHNQLSEGSLDLVRLACELPSTFLDG